MICIATGTKLVQIAATAFTLSWTHSVERTRWTEHWRASPAGLVVARGEIEGSGAGMEPPDDARLVDGRYVYAPRLRPVPELVLAASGATGSGWTLCARGHGCIEIGREASRPVTIKTCPSRPR